MKIVLEPFLMDEEREDFVIFILRLDGRPNAYVWVRLKDNFDPKRDIRMTSFYGLCSYCTQTTDPFYAGKDMPAALIAKATKRLEDCPEDVMNELISEFNKDMKTKMDQESEFKEYSEWEDKALKDAEQSENGLVYF